MASWFSRATSSTKAQFAATAIVSGAVVAGAILGYQAVRRHERVEDLKSSIPELGREGHVADKVSLSLLHILYRRERMIADRRSEAHRFWGRITTDWNEQGG